MKGTSNIEHRTSNIERKAAVQGSTFNVQGSTAIAEVLHRRCIRVRIGGEERELTIVEAEALFKSLAAVLFVSGSNAGMDLLCRKVAAEFGVSPQEILSRDRSDRVARARQVAMYLMRELTALSLESIGAAFGYRDHGTVLYAVRAIESFIEHYPAWRFQMERLKREIGPLHERLMQGVAPLANLPMSLRRKTLKDRTGGNGDNGEVSFSVPSVCSCSKES